MTARLTFWKEAAVAVYHVPAQEPSIAKLVVPLDQLDAIALDEGQFIGASRLEVV